MLDLKSLLNQLDVMTPNEINDMIKGALHEAGIPYSTDGSGEIELENAFPSSNNDLLDDQGVTLRLSYRNMECTYHEGFSQSVSYEIEAKDSPSNDYRFIFSGGNAA